ncbi:MAG: deoxyguanosinetriphosphate triphosphohydrolase [Candidatus Alcyoniella australis]|nr:deoxyguanosinetriphosphate triphosphohydrolase [Candidatus Alcyoniella australis]
MKMISSENYPLASYAARSDASCGRRYPEVFRDSRPAFERDRDRIVHCAAFRRLEYKTQVFVNHEGDYYRTRLTHSIEVAQIARGIARRLQLNQELAEGLALAHDLGHTPFGHAGEATLNRLMSDHGGFEHNRQSLRVVEFLEERYPEFRGLNLTFEFREGIIKHNTIYDRPGFAEAELYGACPPTLEGQLINLADEIAYHNHDLDDGIESGLLPLDDLERVRLWALTAAEVRRRWPNIDQRRLVLRTISALISRFMDDAVLTSGRLLNAERIDSIDDVRAQERSLIVFSEQFEPLRDELRAFLRCNLYEHPKLLQSRDEAVRSINLLFETFLNRPQLMPPKYREIADKEGLPRAICDYIAGMTDRFALEEARRLG